MTVRLADVAARAGVSAATVSRVLNGNYPVAQATRGRVLRAVEELEYVVNGPASSLAAASSDLVGILVHDIADPFFGIIAGAAQTEMTGAPAGAASGGKLAVVCNTGGSPERELTYLTLLQRQRAGAVVVVGGAAEDGPPAAAAGPLPAPDGRGGAARPPAPGSPDAAVATRLARLAASGTRVVLCGRPPLPPGHGGAAVDGAPSGTAAVHAPSPWRSTTGAGRAGSPSTW